MKGSRYSPEQAAFGLRQAEEANLIRLSLLMGIVRY